MKKQTWIAFAAIPFTLGAILLFAHHDWRHLHTNRGALTLLPNDSSAVLFIDLAELRHSPFLKNIAALAPKPALDADYAQFLRDTGFDYEQDLLQLTVAAQSPGTFFAVANGRFDHNRISAYATAHGKMEKRDGREIYLVPMNGSARTISFTFLQPSQIALSNSPEGVAPFLAEKKEDDLKQDWRRRFDRLAGSPAFALIHHDAHAGDASIAAGAQRAMGGFRSPQLSALLSQLQWMTLAGKPEGESLKLIAEGECQSDIAARQLVDLLNSVRELAQIALNDIQARKKIDPALREAYLELLKTADIAKVDRGQTKSVRLVVELTPKFLDAAKVSFRKP